MFIEIHSLDDFHRHLARYETLHPCVIQGLDLTTVTPQLLQFRAEGTTFLGCTLAPAALEHVSATGGLIFPRLPNLPYHPYRPRLYAQTDLMEGFQSQVEGSFEDSVDTAIYEHFRRSRQQGSVLEALAQRLHDHAIDDALTALLENRSVAAIMGGHALYRSNSLYGQIADMARSLAREGIFVATGGGPGAMEAGNLGAWLAPYADSALDEALGILRQEDDYRTHRYLALGAEVQELFPQGGESLAIPTWFYGHEPTNQYCTHIAKYFSNSLREDGLLAIATRGVIYAPGSAGTVQEIFMDATQNHYGTFDWISPMVFFGKDYWRQTLPAVPLLTTLARGKAYEELITATDDPREVVEFILNNPPRPV